MNILLIDDDTLSLEVLGSWFELQGFGHEAHTDPRTAVDAYRSRPAHYDVVITDMKMKHLSGLDVVREVQEANEAATIILMTAFPEEEVRLHETRVPVAGIYRKPIDIEALTEHLINYTGKS